MANFLDKGALSGAVDSSYFFWGPLQSAWHNFQAAYAGEGGAQQRTESAAMGILLSIPVVNIIPFSILVLKAKENLIPKEALVEILPLTLQKPPEKKPVLLLTNSPSTTIQRQPSEPHFTKTLTFQERKSAFQPKHDEPVYVNAPITRSNSFSKAEMKKLQDPVTIGYFMLFPDESPQHFLRKSKINRTFSPNNDESKPIEGLLLTCKEPNLLDKIQNAKANLDTLSQFLKGEFGFNEGDYYYIQGSFNGDPQVDDRHNNAYENVRRSIFSCPKEDYLSLLNHYTFTLYRDVVRIQ